MGEHYDPAEVAQIVTSAGSLSSSDFQLVELLANILERNKINSQVYNEIMDEIKSNLFNYRSDTNLTTLHTKTRQCIKCPARQQPAELPIGNIDNCRALFVIEKPFNQVELQGFKQALELANINLDYTCLSYLTRCHGDKVFDAEIDNCKSYLLDEIEILKPQIIVLMGKTVIETLYQDVVLKEKHGHTVLLGPFKYLLTYTLGYATYTYSIYRQLIDDLSLVNGIISD